MKQQTAVSFLLRELRIEDLAKGEQLSVVLQICEQAKQIEKEQIVEAYFEGFREGRGIDNIDISGKIFYEDTNAERYYDITYQPSENHSPKEI